MKKQAFFNATTQREHAAQSASDIKDTTHKLSEVLPDNTGKTAVQVQIHLEIETGLKNSKEETKGRDISPFC